jgi:DNA-binding NarL/FixJ family response regulator
MTTSLAILTPREYEVAILMAYGYTNQEVANRLVISVRTVETHRRHLMGKLGIRDRAGVVRWALDHELLQ